MRTIRWLCAVLLMLGAAASFAQDAPQPPRREAQPGAARAQRLQVRSGALLVPIPVMESELKLNADQKTKIKGIQDKLREDVDKLRKEGAPGRETIMRLNDILNKASADIEASLDDEQKKKFTNLVKEAQLFNLVGIPPMAMAELKLTEEQRKKLATIASDLQAKQRDIPQAERREKLPALRQEAREKAMALMTEEQKATLKKLAEQRQRRQNNGAPRNP